MTAIITALLPVIVKIIFYILDYLKANEKAKRKFLEFLREMEPHNKSCARLIKSYLSQRDINLEKLNVKTPKQ